MQSHCVGVYYKWVCCVGVMQRQMSHDALCRQLLIEWWCVGDLVGLPALERCVLLCGYVASPVPHGWLCVVVHTGPATHCREREVAASCLPAGSSVSPRLGPP